jgi:hypothetical protein
MAKRFLTVHGIPIPPFKEQKYGSTSTTIRFVLTGKIPAKKNNQMSVTVRKVARDWAKKQSTKRQATWSDVHKAISMCSSKMRGNVKYNDFLKQSKPIILEQMQVWSKRLEHRGIVFPIPKATMSLKFYFKDKYVRDCVNAQQTIQDLLVDCGVIVDDNYNALNPITAQAACYPDELIYSITSIVLTFNM